MDPDVRITGLVDMDFDARGHRIEIRPGKTISAPEAIAELAIERGYAELAGEAEAAEAPPEAESLDSSEGGEDKKWEIDVAAVLAATVDVITEAIEDGELDGVLDELEDGENDRSRPRKGVHDAIAARRLELESAEA